MGKWLRTCVSRTGAWALAQSLVAPGWTVVTHVSEMQAAPVRCRKGPGARCTTEHSPGLVVVIEH